MTETDHAHDHDHAPPTEEDGTLSYYQRLEVAVRELLIEKGVVSADEIRAAIADDHPHFAESVERMLGHLSANEVDTSATPLILGRRLALDPQTESFVGDEEAIALVDRDYRRPYAVPASV